MRGLSTGLGYLVVILSLASIGLALGASENLSQAQALRDSATRAQAKAFEAALALAYDAQAEQIEARMMSGATTSAQDTAQGSLASLLDQVESPGE